MERVSTLCEQNVEILNVAADGTSNYHCSLMADEKLSVLRN
jgi:hypothetical protein